MKSIQADLMCSTMSGIRLHLVPSRIPEPTTFNGPDLRPHESVQTPEQEAEVEQDWLEMEHMAREFRDRYSNGALLRCIARVLDA